MQKLHKRICLGLLSMAFAGTVMFASNSALAKPLVIAEQGSFAAGGTVVQTAGEFDYTKPTNPAGQTLHGDHAYVFYQRPVHAKKLPLVFLHGAGQSAKTWESTPDGRDGFQNIFLRKGYSTYLVDQPRRGRAGQSTVAANVPAATIDQLWYSNFRLGNWPDFYPGVQFPQDKASLEQFFRQMTPNTGAYDEGVIAKAMAATFAKAGDGILVTHSLGGGPGWRTVMLSDKVKAVAAFEPGSGFVFPKGEVPDPLPSTSPFGALGASAVSMEDFIKLTKVPIIIYYGDYIPAEMTDEWNKDNWRVRLIMARKFADAINRHGGDATVVHLPEIGIYGNTHFLFSDLNNVEIAEHFAKWLKEKHLDK